MKEPYMLPEEDCERLNRTQFNAVKMMLAHISNASYWLKDIWDRLDCIPNGRQRAAGAVGMLRSINNDVIGTITRAQAKQLYGTAKDYEIRFLPKATPGTRNILLTKDEGIALLNIAREKCAACVEDGNSCRNCTLYQFLESTTPLDDWGNGLMCPYALAEWE